MASIYLYPDTPFGRQEGANDYMSRLRETLNGPHRVINGPTRLGMLHLLYFLPKTDIVYFNWIEDLADKQFGYLQVALLLPVLLLCRLFRKQIVWFVHNNTSHTKTHWAAKRYTTRLMRTFAHTILAHVPEAETVAERPVAVFDHPVQEFTEPGAATPHWDLLLWGSVSPYKGVLEFVRLHAARPELRNLKVLVAGRFSSEELFRDVCAAAHPNVTIRNEVIPEARLSDLMQRCRYVFFSYQSPSVFASGALCKTLSFGKSIIGPDRGAFRALGRQGLIHTFRDQEDLAALLTRLQHEAPIDPEAIRSYALNHSWAHFGDFLEEQLGSCRERSRWGFVLR